MSTQRSVVRDERTVAVENAGYKWAFTFIVFALFIDVMCRAIVRHEAAWDLMALVIVGGAVCTVYQARQKALPHGWVKAGVLVACVAAVVGIITVAVVFALAKYGIVDLMGPL
jgi:hypothetical protein